MKKVRRSGRASAAYISIAMAEELLVPLHVSYIQNLGNVSLDAVLDGSCLWWWL